MASKKGSKPEKHLTFNLPDINASNTTGGGRRKSTFGSERTPSPSRRNSGHLNTAKDQPTRRPHRRSTLSVIQDPEGGETLQVQDLARSQDRRGSSSPRRGSNFAIATEAGEDIETTIETRQSFDRSVNRCSNSRIIEENVPYRK
ncbi:unnamed protein product [Owenia fusiformis]|uniref:Uncharacterized protein n=1 Tax=Owenia fusiformis TaxID=6347 RepID=A0A8J1TCH1_OWEFU|nr:unnamed protein product [Owenia fusiformis]